MQISLTDYPSVTRTISFDVEFRYSCKNVPITVPLQDVTSLVDDTYIVHSAPDSQSFSDVTALTSYVPGYVCGATTLSWYKSSVGKPSPVSIDDTLFSVDDAG